MTLELVFAKPSDADFLAVFNRLLVALREPADDTGTTQMIYFDALKDLPMQALTDGAAALMKETGRRFFPTTAEWRTAAEKAQMAHFKAALQPGERTWALECNACADCGWQPFECPAEPCGFHKPHAAHSYVRICPCRPTNRTYMRHQQFGSGE